MNLTDSQLAQVVDKLKAAQAFQSHAWNKVIEEARAYALMKVHSSYMEKGSVYRVSRADQQSYIESMKANLLYAIERAALEDTLAGQTFNKALGG